jgi:chemotaxis protein methyltransferase CheR
MTGLFPETTDVKDLTNEDYQLFRRLVYEKSGINLGDQKMQLVRARLGKRVRSGGFGSFKEYYRFVAEDQSGEELCYLLDAISTNTTHLFREIRHFNLLREKVHGWLENRDWRSANGNVVRVWSAACSSGEEPHSLAMVIHHELQRFPGMSCKILATDLSTKVLSKAKEGIYDIHRVGTVPPEYKNRYLQKLKSNGQTKLQIGPEIRSMIRFVRFNLMTPTFPFKHGFHVIFCRNVMIYFDRPTQERLVAKLAQHLLPGGYLMIGHSESLNGINHPLGYVEPTVYKKG